LDVLGYIQPFPPDARPIYDWETREEKEEEKKKENRKQFLSSRALEQFTPARTRSKKLLLFLLGRVRDERTLVIDRDIEQDIGKQWGEVGWLGGGPDGCRYPCTGARLVSAALLMSLTRKMCGCWRLPDVLTSVKSA
jgi:hypothetical protein